MVNILDAEPESKERNQWNNYDVLYLVNKFYWPTTKHVTLKTRTCKRLTS